MTITLDALQHIFKEHFGHPFLKDGTVKVRIIPGHVGQSDVLSLTIGRRNVWIDENGNVDASGTDLRGVKQL